MTSSESNDEPSAAPQGLGLERLPSQSLRRPLGDSAKALVRAALFDEPVSHRIGRFEIRGKLGQGGMATVLRAYDDSLDREVALKVLHPQRRDEQGERLRREAQALARLSHPNVVQVYEVGQIDDQTFIAMELVQGQTLAQWQRPAKPWRECVEVYIQAAAGLAAAHAQGLVHRDFKPTNCIIDPQGRVRVLDFGLVRHAPEDSEPYSDTDEDLANNGPAQEASLTQTGAVLGTLAYMAPEQGQRRTADAASDQFSFCVSLYEALYGHRPFERDGAQVLLGSEGATLRPAPAGAAVPDSLRRIVLRGLSLTPEDRWPSMDALRAELSRRVAPRRARWLAVAGVVGLLGAGLGLYRYAEVGFRCEGAEQQLAQIWDGARKDEVEAAILATDLPYAAGTWTKIEPRLDAYAELWVSTHAETCEATRVTETQTEEVMELRMRCLGRRRNDLQQVVDVLASADDRTVERAVPLVVNLPDLARCDDIDALRAALPPPEDPETVRAVDALRQQLSRATTLRIAGRMSQSEQVAEAALTLAESLDYAPTRAEAWLERGLLHQHQEQPEAAEGRLRQAYTESAAIGHLQVESRAASALAQVVGAQAARPDEGLVWSTTALALARHPHADADALPQATFARATILHAKSDWDGAAEQWQQALSLWEQLHGPEHPDVLTTIGSLAMVEGDRGELSAAIEILDRAIERAEQVLGPEHPEVATMLANRGAFQFRQGEYEASAQSLERSKVISEQVFGTDGPALISVLGFYGNALRMQGKNEEALVEFRRAVAIAEQSGDEFAGEHAQALNGIGLTEYLRGNTDAGIEAMAQALALLESAPGDHARDLPMHLYNLGSILVGQKRWNEAKLRFERALELAESTLGAEHPLVSAQLYGLGDVELRLGERASALAHAERSLAMRETLEVPPDWLAESRFLVAKALGDTAAERTRARRLAQQAHDTYSTMGDRFPNRTLNVEDWLATHPEL